MCLWVYVLGDPLHYPPQHGHLLTTRSSGSADGVWIKYTPESTRFIVKLFTGNKVHLNEDFPLYFYVLNWNHLLYVFKEAQLTCFIMLSQCILTYPKVRVMTPQQAQKCLLGVPHLC